MSIEETEKSIGARKLRRIKSVIHTISKLKSKQGARVKAAMLKARRAQTAQEKQSALSEALQQTNPPRARVRVWRKIVLQQLAVCPNLTVAAKAAGIARPTLTQYINRHPDFAAQVEKAKVQGVETLEAYCWARATTGTRRPVFMKGKDGVPVQVGEIVEHSDRLAEFLLKAHAPEKYNPPTQTELSGPGGTALPSVIAPTQVQIIIPDNGRSVAEITQELQQIGPAIDATASPSQSAEHANTKEQNS